MNKKILIIGVTLLTAVLLGVGLYFYFDTGEETDPGNETPRGNFFGNLFPFGDGDKNSRPQNNNTGSGENTGVGDTGTQSGSGAALKQLTLESVAAATFPQGASTTSVQKTVRYIERAAGNVFDIDLQTLEKKRLSNTTLAGIHEGVWDRSGNQIILRFLNNNDVIKTFSAKVPTTTSITAEGEENPLEGVFLEDDIPYIVSFEDELFYFTFQNRNLNGYTSSFNGGNREIILSAPFTEWVPQWVDEKTLSFNTKASGSFPGFLYFVDIEGGEFSSILSDIEGLTSNTNPQKTALLYSEIVEGDLELHSYNIEEKSSQKLSIATLPEKCTWSKTRVSVVYCGVPTNIQSGLYPDEWYQGLVSFSDDIWEIDVLRNVSELIVSPSEYSGRIEGIDMIDLVVSNNDEYLIFTNKKDSTLWSLQLN